MKLALYSVSYSGIWYKGEALSLEEFITKAAEYGFDGIEIDAKRPHGFPPDLDAKRRKEIRKMAENKNLEICAVAGNNNFVSPFDELRENEILMLAEQLRLARDLGSPFLRIFLSWRGINRINGIANYSIPVKYDIDHISPDVTNLQRWKWAKDAIIEGVKIAERYGVTMVLQNHGPLIQNYRDMLSTVKEIGSEHLKCCFDCPCESIQSDDYIKQAVNEVGDLQAYSHYNGEFEKKNGKIVLTYNRGYQTPFDLGAGLTNYPVFIKALKNIGYKGYMSYEFCHSPLDEYKNICGIERIHEQVQYAKEYMVGLINN
ncbi:MAG: sugar phosphate isomerase/epimerase [Actinobacteria bacterium]|nr:sugar phosphate isomerase/epimerase [Actinomycetota bacterium]